MITKVVVHYEIPEKILADLIELESFPIDWYEQCPITSALEFYIEEERKYQKKREEME